MMRCAEDLPTQLLNHLPEVLRVSVRCCTIRVLIPLQSEEEGGCYSIAYVTQGNIW